MDGMDGYGIRKGAHSRPFFGVPGMRTNSGV